jgi:hypothetical protein
MVPLVAAIASAAFCADIALDTLHTNQVRYLCMAYGANPTLYADAISVRQLPQQRAKNCRYEYRRFAFGFEKLIAPYIDDKLLAAVKARSWFDFDTSNNGTKQ